MDTIKSINPSDNTSADQKQKAKDIRLKGLCQDFEAVLIEQMLSAMRKNVPGDGVFGKSNQKDIYESMFYQRMAVDMAHKDSGFGIASQLYQQLKKLDDAVSSKHGQAGNTAYEAKDKQTKDGLLIKSRIKEDVKI